VAKQLVLGLPAGSLQETTFGIFKKAGFNLSLGKRSYVPIIDDDEIECLLMRAQEIPSYVERGVLDCGISGYDWIQESKAKVREISELLYSKQGFGAVQIVVAVPESSPIRTVRGLAGKVIATEMVGITKQYLANHGVKATVQYSWGATEVKPPKLADAIVELTETGSSLRANHLRVLDVVMQSTTRFMANRDAWKDSFKRQKMLDISDLLNGALRAEGMVGLKLNVLRKDLKTITTYFPALRNPTISDLTDPDWAAVETVINEHEVRELIPKLKAMGAEGIVEYPLNKIIL
jgi:ATP phosphoribosyltransferase